MLADDHAVLRQGLRALIDLQENMSIVAEACDGDETIERYRNCRPDVLLLDPQLPKICGWEVVERIRLEFPLASVLILSVYPGDEDAYRCLRAGAKGYLLKDTPRRDLIDAISSVARGERFIPTRLAVKPVEATSDPRLSEPEIQVLRSIAQGKSNREIAFLLGLKASTVTTHVDSLLRKLESANRAEAAAKALRCGLIRL